MNTSKTYGTLFLIPTPLGDNPPLEVLPLSIKTKVEELTHFIIENEKATRSFIKKLTPNKNQNTLQLYP
jgi:16S rRNA (cytidine1402-2'-O)-methyltransferase